jgi:ribonuclease J
VERLKKTLYLTIHRGTKEIGGSCVELATKNTRILIDIGLPLVDEGGQSFNLGNYLKLTNAELFEKNIAKDIPGLYKEDNGSKPPNAILISHSHPDHYGLLTFVKSQIPLYMSEGCLELIKATYYFKGINTDFNNVEIVEDKKYFVVGDFKITPYLVDHSGFDSYAFLVEAEGKRIFYSGDFRGHGKKSRLFDKFIAHPPKNIDYLIMEGTGIDGKDGYSEKEEELRDRLVTIFKENSGLVFFACSSQNIDRISSLYSACRRSGRTLVLDPYTVHLLDVLRKRTPSIPQFDFKDIRVFFTSDSNTRRLAGDKILYKYKDSKITYDEIEEKKDSLVVKPSYGIRKAFAKKGYIEGSILIYSMWNGYFENEKPFWDEYGISPMHIHTSGHANVTQLKEFANSLNPTTIIPIHTLLPDKFPEYFGSKVKMLSDGKSAKL